MICPSPIPFETLAALWAGELAPDDAALVEDHLFSCDDCHAASERLAAVVDGIRGSVPPVISRAHLDRLLAGGTQIVQTVVDAGVDARARFAPGVDLLVHILRGDLTGAERVDVELVSPDDAHRMSFEHVPFDAVRGEVLVACQRHYEEFAFTPTFRVHAVTEGTRRRVGDYFVHHEWR